MKRASQSEFRGTPAPSTPLRAVPLLRRRRRVTPGQLRHRLTCVHPVARWPDRRRAPFLRTPRGRFPTWVRHHGQELRPRLQTAWPLRPFRHSDRVGLRRRHTPARRAHPHDPAGVRTQPSCPKSSICRFLERTGRSGRPSVEAQLEGQGSGRESRCHQPQRRLSWSPSCRSHLLHPAARELSTTMSAERQTPAPGWRTKRLVRGH